MPIVFGAKAVSLSPVIESMEGTVTVVSPLVYAVVNIISADGKSMIRKLLGF